MRAAPCKETWCPLSARSLNAASMKEQARAWTVLVVSLLATRSPLLEEFHCLCPQTLYLTHVSLAMASTQSYPVSGTSFPSSENHIKVSCLQVPITVSESTGGSPISFSQGPFLGKTIRTSARELQKADAGRKCALSSGFHLCVH